MKFFRLTRNERLGLLGLTFLFTGILAFKYYSNSTEAKIIASVIEKDKILHLSDSSEVLLSNEFDQKTIQKKLQEVEDVNVVPFESFNPNEVDAAYWVELGFKSKLSTRIQDYISKGNGISKSSDLLKVYGMKKKWVEAIEDSLVFRLSPIDINLASSNEFKKVKGIGEKLSDRIVKFRSKLGGFHSLNQLFQVYGIDSLTIEANIEVFKIEKPHGKIDIRIVGLNELVKHPYLKEAQAEEIIKLRSVYEIVDSTRLRNIFTTKEWEQVKPYLEWKN